MTHPRIPLYALVSIALAGAGLAAAPVRADEAASPQITMKPAITCEQAGDLYETAASCQSFCSSGSENIPAQLMATLESYSFTVSAGTLCAAGQQCCLVMTDQIKKALDGGTTPEPNAEKMTSLLGAATASDTAASASPKAPNVVSLPDPLSGANLQSIIAHLIRIFAGIAGSVALLMFVYGGVMYILSGGDQTKVKNATKILKNAALGIVLIFGAYLFVSTIIDAFLS